MKGSLDCSRLSSRNQMDGMTVLRYRKTMGENLKEDHQRRGKEGVRLFIEICFFFFCHPLKKKESLFPHRKHRISDRQLFSSYMQIPLDSAKPSP